MVKAEKIIIYTDGCSRGNPGPGGCAAVLLYGKLRKEIARGFRLTTNNRMEILAAIEGLRALKNGGNYQVTLYTDSRLLSDTFNKGWIWNWMRNDWKKSNKEKVLNIDLWQQLLEVYNKHKVKITWVQAHSGIEENERCDYMSKQAANNLAKEIDFVYERENQ